MADNNSTAKQHETAIDMIKQLQNDYENAKKIRIKSQEAYHHEKNNLNITLNSAEEEIQQIKTESQRIINVMRRKINKLNRDYRRELRAFRKEMSN